MFRFWLENRSGIRMFFDAANDTGAGGSQNGSGAGADDKKQPPSTDSSATPSGTDPAPDKGSDNQVIMDKDSFNERITQAKTNAVADLLQSLGLSKVDELKTVIDAHKEAENAKKTDAERLQSQINDLEAKRVAAEEKANAAEAALRETKLEGALRDAAKNAHHPDDVILWARGKNRLTELLDDKGEINQDAMNTLIEDCQKERPAWFASVNPGSPSNSDAKPPKSDPKQATERKKEFRSAINSWS